MTDLLFQIIFGWPFIILSLLVSVTGLITKHYWLLLIGAVLSIPFSYYLSGAPGFRNIVFVLPLFQVGAVFAVRAKKMFMAWLLLLPVILVIGWVAYAVLSQPF
jgi:hypothetical protein